MNHSKSSFWASPETKKQKQNDHLWKGNEGEHGHRGEHYGRDQHDHSWADVGAEEGDGGQPAAEDKSF